MAGTGQGWAGVGSPSSWTNNPYRETEGRPEIAVSALDDYFFEIGEGNVAGKSFIHKFGRNPDVDPADGFLAVWNIKSDYTGFNATVAETLEVFSSDIADAGTLLSSGTATGGGDATIEDAGATFISDGVAVGDIVLDDTQIFHGVIKEVTSETVLTVWRFDREASSDDGVVAEGDTYRVATPASTGAAVIEILFLLDGGLSNETAEFIILDGTTGVDSVGTYMRCSRGRAVLVGSGGSNVGNLTCRQKATVVNVFFQMPIGYNATMLAAYTIPFEKDGHILDTYATLAGKTQANCNIRFVTRHVGEPFTVREEFSISGTGNSYVLRKYDVPKDDMPGGTDIKVMADTDSVGTAVGAGFDIILSEHN